MWWDGEWPAAHGKVAKDLAEISGSLLEQIKLANHIYVFLQLQDSHSHY